MGDLCAQFATNSAANLYCVLYDLAWENSAKIKLEILQGKESLHCAPEEEKSWLLL